MSFLVIAIIINSKLSSGSYQIGIRALFWDNGNKKSRSFGRETGDRDRRGENRGGRAGRDYHRAAQSISRAIFEARNYVEPVDGGKNEATAG